MLAIPSSRRRWFDALSRTVVVASALVVCALTTSDSAYAIPQDRLSWVTLDTEDPWYYVQHTVDIGTTDESVQNWVVNDTYTLVGGGPVSPDGYQRVDDSSNYSLIELGFSDAANLRPLTANSHYPWSEHTPPEGGQSIADTEWDPNGQALYAGMSEEGSDWPLTANSSIVHIDLDGDELTPVIDFPEDFWLVGPSSPTVNADGSRLAFVTQVDPAGDPTGAPIEFGPYWIAPQALYIANSDGTSPTVLTESDMWLSILQPDLSPDGSKIVFTGVKADLTIGVFTISTTTGYVTEVAPMDYYTYSVAKWSPDEQYIAYAEGNSTESHPLHIVLMDADGANQQTLETLPEGSDEATVMSSFSFRKSSTDPDPGPGPFPPSEPASAARVEAQGTADGSHRFSPRLTGCGGRSGDCATGDQRQLRRVAHLCHALRCGRHGARRPVAAGRR